MAPPARKAGLGYLGVLLTILIVFLINSFIVQIIFNMIVPRLLLSLGVHHKPFQPIDFVTAMGIFLLINVLFPHNTFIMVQKQIKS